MNTPADSQETSIAQTPHRPKVIRRAFLLLLLVLLLIPVALKALAGYSPVVNVRNTVDALGGRVNTAVAVPEFLQSISGNDWDGWDKFYGGVEVDGILLDQTPTGDEDLVLLQQTPRLSSLTLGHTKITDAGVKNFSHVVLLRRLDLNGTKITDAGMEALKALTVLQDLNLSTTAISDVGAAKLAGLKNLITLDLSGTAVTDVSLSSVSGIPGLTTLILDHCNLTDEGLASLKNCKSLTSLSLAGIPLTGSFLKELNEVPLEYLNLVDSSCDGTAFTDGGQGRSLKNLNLENCPVEDAGVAAIARFPTIETLSLDNTKITGQGIAVLKDMPQLITLSLNSTPVSAEELRELKDAPNLKLIKANKTGVTRGDVDTLTAEIKSFAVFIGSSGGGG